MEPIIITAIFKPKENFQEQLLLELKKVQVLSQEENGCVMYTLHQSVEDDTFVLYEVWKDEVAVERHNYTRHYLEFRESIKDFVLTREVYRLKTI